jgi:hypothetical protein
LRRVETWRLRLPSSTKVSRHTVSINSFLSYRLSGAFDEGQQNIEVPRRQRNGLTGPR